MHLYIYRPNKLFIDKTKIRIAANPYLSDKDVWERGSESSPVLPQSSRLLEEDSTYIYIYI